MYYKISCKLALNDCYQNNNQRLDIITIISWTGRYDIVITTTDNQGKMQTKMRRKFVRVLVLLLTVNERFALVVYHRFL